MRRLARLLHELDEAMGQCARRRAAQRAIEAIQSRVPEDAHQSLSVAEKEQASVGSLSASRVQDQPGQLQIHDEG